MTHGESSLSSLARTLSLQTNACGCRSRSSHGDTVTDPHRHTPLLIHLSYPIFFSAAPPLTHACPGPGNQNDGNDANSAMRPDGNGTGAWDGLFRQCSTDLFASLAILLHPAGYLLLTCHGKGPWDDIGGAFKHILIDPVDFFHLSSDA